MTKRLLFVIHGFPPTAYGGVENNTLQLVQALSKKYEVFVFTRVGDISKDDFTTYESDITGIKVMYVVNNFKWQSKRFVDRFYCEKMDLIFEEYIKEQKPDIVHIQHLVGLSMGFIDILKKYEIPIILTPHDYWFGCHRTNLITNLGEICQKRDDSIYCVDCVLRPSIANAINSKAIHLLKIKILKNMKKKRFESMQGEDISRFILNLTDSISDNIKAVIGRRLYMKNQLLKFEYIVFPSAWLESVFRVFGFDFCNYQVLPLGFKMDEKTLSDKSKLSNELYNDKGRPIRIGYAGAMLRHKGIHILIEAMDILSKKGIGKDKIRLCVYGTSNDMGYIKELKRISEGLDIDFKGAYPHEELNTIMSNLDLLIVPSLWHEIHPLVIREGLLCGVPVITTDLSAQKDGITDYKSGILVKPADPIDLADKIEYILKNPDFIKNAKEYIREVEVKKIPSIEEYASRIAEIYEKVLG